MSTTVSTSSPDCSKSSGTHVLCALLLLVTCFLSLVPRTASAQAGENMEVFWEFRHGGIVNTVVSSRYDGERFYLSMADIFGALQLNIIQEPSVNQVRGFYVQESREYEIDFNANRALLGNTEIRFDSTEYLKEDLGFFLTPSLFQRIFNLSVTLDERTLAMTLDTPDEMPVIATYRRRASRVVREEATFLERNAPLLFDRNRSFMSGGVAGYRISADLTGLSPRADLNLRGGGELLGGDLELGVNGRYAASPISGGPVQFNVDTWRWRYVMMGLPAFRQAQVGELTSDGLRSFNYVGTRLSNDPVGVQRFFGSYPMRIESEPGWEIEVYLNSQLVGVQVADAAGIATFSVPITYGSTTVIVREYGPSGEYEETERRIEVPFNFAPPGELRYNLFAGRETGGGRNLLQATTTVGITSWLTAKWGFDYVTPDTSVAGENLANLSWGQISARLGPSYILTAQVAPGARYNAALSAYYPSLASFQLEYTQYGDHLIYNRSRQLHESRASVTLPLRVFRMPINWRTSITERGVDAGRYTYSFQNDLTFQPGVLRVNVGVRSNGSYQDGEFLPGATRIEPRLGYSFARTAGVPKPLRGVLFSLRSSYNVESSQLTNVSFNWSRTIGRVIRVQSDIVHQVQTGNTSVNFRLAFDLSTVRATTSADWSMNAPTRFSQDVSGALSYDVGSRNLAFTDRDWVGRSAATIRMFVDYNGDGRQNGEEPIIENGGVTFRRGVTTRKESDGLIVAYNLQPYEQYNLEVDQSQIRNPFWVPQFEEFSFISDPNVHKVIDIPFRVSGELTGSVLREDEGDLVSVPGLKVHMEQLDGDRKFVEPVFSDGTFYKLGIPPGRYRAWVDSTQMGVLRTVSDPPVHEFDIEVTQLGDTVDGIDFVLRDESAAVAAQTDEPAEPEPDQDAAQQPEEAPTAQQPEQLPAGQQPDQAPDAQPDAAPAQPGVVQAEVFIIDSGLAGLRQLARMVYDDETLWPKIWLANTDVIEEPTDVRSGMRLTIPRKAPLTPVERAAGAGYEDGGIQPDQQPQGQQPQPGQQGGQDQQPQPGQQGGQDQQPQPGQQGGQGPDAAGERTHLVSPDDVSLMGLAREYYSDGFLWPKIWLANYDVLPNPDRLEVGMRLRIPAGTSLSTTERQALQAYQAGDMATVRELIDDGAAEDAQQGQAQEEAQQPQAQPEPSGEQDPPQQQNQQGQQAPQTADIQVRPDQQTQEAEQAGGQAADETQAGAAQGDAVQTQTADTAQAAAQPEPEAQQTQAPENEAPGEQGQDADADTTSDATVESTEPLTIHRVVPGDISLMNLSRRFYNDPSLWPKIWVANQEVLSRPEDLAVGMELEIPAKAPLTAEERDALAEYNSSR